MHKPLMPGIYLLLAVGIVAASQSGNIIRLGDASPVAITAWRLAMAALFFLPGSRIWQFDFTRLTGRDFAMLGLSALFLALHFYTWIYAVQMTSVANAAIVFSLNPIFIAALEVLLFKEKIGKGLVAAVALGIVGGGVVGYQGLILDGHHMIGILSAFACALMFTGYFLVGRLLRRKMTSGVYVVTLYGTAAAISLLMLLVFKLPIFTFDHKTWLCFGLMALVPTIIGHTSFNIALGSVKASWIATMTLAEPLLAGVGAYFFWGEQLTLSVGIGFLFIVFSTIVLAFTPATS